MSCLNIPSFKNFEIHIFQSSSHARPISFGRIVCKLCRAGETCAKTLTGFEFLWAYSSARWQALPCRNVVGWPHSCTVYLFTIFEKSQWVNITVKVARWKKFLRSTKIKIPLVDQKVALNANVVNKICFKGNCFFESEVWKDRFLFLLTMSTCFCFLVLFKMLLAILCSSLACRDMTDFV